MKGWQPLNHAIRYGWVIVVELLLISTGCHPEEERRDSQVCQLREDCPVGLSCIASVCGIAPMEERTLAFRFIPPKGSPLREQYAGPQRVRLTEVIPFGLTPSVSVSGTVTQGKTTTLADATLFFAPEGGSLQAIVSAEVTSGGRYHVNLLPGKYRVSVFSDSNEIPPFYWDKQEYRSNTEAKYAMPSASTIREVTLTTNFPSGQTFGNRSKDLMGGQIYGYDTSNRRQLTTYGVISPGANEQQSPSITLKAYATNAPYSVVVTPNKPISLVPSRLFSQAFSCATNCVSLIPSDHRSQNVSLTFSTNLLEVKTVQLQLVAPPSQPQEPLKGIEISLIRTDGAESTTLRQKAGQRGVIVADVIPGTYQIRVDSPPTSRIASTIYSNVTLHETETTRLILKAKRSLSGQVLGHDNQPLSEGRLEFRALGNEQGEQDVYMEPIMENGRFSVWLNEGMYVMTVVPTSPLHPRKAWIIEKGTPKKKIWRLDVPHVLQGQLYELAEGKKQLKSEMGHVGSVGIEVLEQVGNKWMVVGKGVSDRDGFFRVLLPAPSK